MLPVSRHASRSCLPVYVTSLLCLPLLSGQRTSAYISTNRIRQERYEQRVIIGLVSRPRIVAVHHKTHIFECTYCVSIPYRTMTIVPCPATPESGKPSRSLGFTVYLLLFAATSFLPACVTRVKDDADASAPSGPELIELFRIGDESLDDTLLFGSIGELVAVGRSGRTFVGDEAGLRNLRFYGGRPACTDHRPARQRSWRIRKTRIHSLIRTYGEEGFVRTVALVVVAANVHRLGLLLKEKGKRRRRWY